MHQAVACSLDWGCLVCFLHSAAGGLQCWGTSGPVIVFLLGHALAAALEQPCLQGLLQSTAGTVPQTRQHLQEWPQPTSRDPLGPDFRSLVALQGLKTHMRLLLLEHYRKSGKQKPQALVWYRDGVSEGQFPECSRVEVGALLPRPLKCLHGCTASGGQAFSRPPQGSSAPACSG